MAEGHVSEGWVCEGGIRWYEPGIGSLPCLFRKSAYALMNF
jgi:hypothetical protein